MLMMALCLIWGILAVALILGFAYLVWIFAAKESGATKLNGQIIAWVIIIATVLLVLLGGYHGQRMMTRGGQIICPMEGKMMVPGMMMNKGMMGK